MRRAFAALGLIEILTGACHKAAPILPEDATAPPLGDRSEASADASDASPRCTISETSSFGDDEGQDLDIGDGLLTALGAFVGVSRTVRGSRLTSIARTLRHEDRASYVDLGPASSNVSPPTPFVREDEVFAVGRVASGGAETNTAGHAETGELELFRVASGGQPAMTTPELLVTLPPTGPDASAVAAVAAPLGSPLGAVLAWDEDDARPASNDLRPRVDTEVRGAIRVAFVGPDMRTLVRVDFASPDTTDAERPRVALREGGFWVAWIARQSEPRKDATPEVEAPGQERAFRWVELLALDARGKPVGAVRRVTASTGHVSGFVMATGGTPAEGATEAGAPQGGTPEVRGLARLDLYVGLDEERTLGAGGGITHIALGPEGPPRVLPVLTEGVARAAVPWLIRGVGRPGWLLYVDAAEGADHVRSLLLDVEGNPVGPPSLEPALDDARPVGTSSSTRGASAPRTASPPTSERAEILASTQTRPGSLRWLSCRESP